MRVLWAAVLLLTTACSSSSGGGGGPGSGPLVVATTTILGDVAANVVGDEGRVQVLLPAGVDPHEFQLSSRQAQALAQADLVVATGLGLEGSVATVLEAAGDTVLEVGPRLDPMRFDDGGSFDPHVWMDPLRMAGAARLISDALDGSFPDGAWARRADAYADALAAADAEIRSLLAEVPAQRRTLVTSHDSMRYFAARYGLTVLGTVIPSGGTLAAPSSADLARLIDEMAAHAVPVVFTETTEPGALAEAVAAEAGVDTVELYTGSLGEAGSGAATYIDMLLTDARRIAAALAP